VQQDGGHRGHFLCLGHAGSSDNLELEVRSGSTPETRRASSITSVSSRDYRVYTITMGNVIVTGFFACITVISLTAGVYLAILTANTPGMAPTSTGCCAQWSSILMAFGCLKRSATTPSNSPQLIPRMCDWRSSDGGNHTNSHTTLLRFVFSEVPSA